MCSALLLSGGTLLHAQQQTPMANNPFVLVIHGGAGTIERSTMSPEREKEYRAGLERALTAGYDILRKGGSSLDATEAAVRVLEDDPHFNAGKGAVFTSAGSHEMDAAVMDGATLRAGSVCSIKHVKNPISLARLVMERSGHVMMSGDGAEAFAKASGVELVDQKYFYTQERYEAWQRVKEKQKAAEKAGHSYIMSAKDRHGTVGAVALDVSGNLAAATSTGGTTNKRPGRVGDTPVIGAGTYANNATCAVSCTGDGEYFIRANVAHEVSALMEHSGMSLADAAETALARAKKLGGEGGLIALDQHGNYALPFNSAGMYRGHVGSDGRIEIEIYRSAP